MTKRKLRKRITKLGCRLAYERAERLHLIQEIIRLHDDGLIKSPEYQRAEKVLQQELKKPLTDPASLAATSRAGNRP